MTNRERFQAALNGQKTDRLPIIEWAGWWDKTLEVWRGEDAGIPSQQQEIYRYLGMDIHHQLWVPVSNGKLPAPAHHGAPVLSEPEQFSQLLPSLYPREGLEYCRRWFSDLKAVHDSGETVIWFTLEGFFWFPRTLFGIENHLYAF